MGNFPGGSAGAEQHRGGECLPSLPTVEFLSFVIFGGAKCDFIGDLSRLLILQITGKKGRWAQERNWRCNGDSVSQVLDSHLNSRLQIRASERKSREKTTPRSLSPLHFSPSVLHTSLPTLLLSGSPAPPPGDKTAGRSQAQDAVRATTANNCLTRGKHPPRVSPTATRRRNRSPRLGGRPGRGRGTERGRSRRRSARATAGPGAGLPQAQLAPGARPAERPTAASRRPSPAPAERATVRRRAGAAAEAWPLGPRCARRRRCWRRLPGTSRYRERGAGRGTWGRTPDAYAGAGWPHGQVSESPAPARDGEADDLSGRCSLLRLTLLHPRGVEPLSISLFPSPSSAASPLSPPLPLLLPASLPLPPLRLLQKDPYPAHPNPFPVLHTGCPSLLLAPKQKPQGPGEGRGHWKRTAEGAGLYRRLDFTVLKLTRASQSLGRLVKKQIVGFYPQGF